MGRRSRIHPKKPDVAKNGSERGWSLSNRSQKEIFGRPRKGKQELRESLFKKQKGPKKARVRSALYLGKKSRGVGKNWGPDKIGEGLSPAPAVARVISVKGGVRSPVRKL